MPVGPLQGREEHALAVMRTGDTLGKYGRQGTMKSRVFSLSEDLAHIQYKGKGFTSIPLVAQYQKALKAKNPKLEPGFVSLEGYMVGQLVIQALHRLGPSVSRQSLLSTIKEVGEFDLGGIKLSYAKDDNQGMDKVFLTIIQPDGTIVAVDDLRR